MRRPAVYVLTAATVLVLGANWPIMAAGVDLVPALWLAALRMAGSAAVVAVVLAVRGRLERPHRADLPILLSVGVGRLAVVTSLVFTALRFVPPGRSSILAYTGALWAAPLGALVLHERLTWLRIGGLALGCAGLVLLLEPWSLDWGDAALLSGVAMLLVAAAINASSTVHIRAHRWVGSPIQLMPWQLGLAAIPIALVAVAIEGAPDVRWTGETVAIVAYQVILASAFALWGLLTIGRSLPAITANLSVMAVPVVGLATSVVFADEPLTAAVATSLVLVLGGVALGLLADRRPSGPEPERVVPVD
jgi:drug/metabolite transporter (DMT)-like permease